MTFFYINDKPFSQACRRNNRIMKEAKRLWKLYGVEQATKYIQEEVEKTYADRNRSNIPSKKSFEYFKTILDESDIPVSIWARAMGFSESYIRAVKCGMVTPSIVFEKKFKQTEKKIKKLFKVKK